MYGQKDIYNAGGFGEPGVHCDLSSVYGELESLYGADGADIAEFGSLSGPTIYGMLEENFGDLSALSSEEVFGLFKNLRIKWKRNRIARILGRLKKLMGQGKEDKAKKRAATLAKVVGKLQSLEPDYDPTDEVQAWMAFASGDIDHPDDWNADGGFTIEGDSVSDAGDSDSASIFTTARTLMSADGQSSSTSAPRPPRRPLPPRRPPLPHRQPQPQRSRGPGARGRGAGMPPRRGGGGVSRRARFAGDDFGRSSMGIEEFQDSVQGNHPLSRSDLFSEAPAIQTSFGSISRHDLFGSLDDKFDDIADNVIGGSEDAAYGRIFRRPTWTRKSLSKQIASKQTAYQKAVMRGDVEKAHQLKSKIGELMSIYREIQSMPELEVVPVATPGRDIRPFAAEAVFQEPSGFDPFDLAGLEDYDGGEPEDYGSLYAS